MGGSGSELYDIPMYVPALAAALAAATLIAAHSLPAPDAPQPAARARITGTLAAPDGRPLLTAAAVLVPRDTTTPLPLDADHVELRPDGRFVFGDVPPGNYEIRVRAEIDRNGPMAFGSVAVSVQGRDVTGIAVPLLKGAAVHGTVKWETRGFPADRARILVRAPLADGTSFGDSLTGTVAADGSFRIRGVMPGWHFFQVEGLPGPWGVKAVYLQGRDISDLPLEIEAGGRIAGVRIVLSTALTEVRGTVRDSAGAPAGGALVIAAPPAGGVALRGSLRFRNTRADRDGRYQLRGLMPGEYRLSAVAGVSDARSLGADALAHLAAGTVAVTAGAGGVETRDLTAVAAAGR
jgi:hypothetical protein